MRKILIYVILLFATIISVKATDLIPGSIMLRAEGGRNSVGIPDSYTTAELQTLLNRVNGYGWGFTFETSPTGESTVDGVRYLNYGFGYPPNTSGETSYFNFGVPTPLGWHGYYAQPTLETDVYYAFVDSNQLDENGGTGTIFFHFMYSSRELSSLMAEIKSQAWAKDFVFSANQNQTRVVNYNNYYGYPFTYPPNTSGVSKTFNVMPIASTEKWDGKLYQPKIPPEPEPIIEMPIPSPSTNWRMSNTYHSEDPNCFTTDIIYYDALGRPVQQVAVNASSQRNKDIISIIEYDDLGRSDAKTYLPFVSDLNNYGKKNATSAQKRYYQHYFSIYVDPDKDYAYGSKTYDNKGLVISSNAPGQSSHDHPILYEYGKNIDSVSVKKYRIHTDKESLFFEGYYPAGMLTVQKASQSNLPTEQQSQSYIYTNSTGQTIAEEVRAGGDRRFTYYVYDDMGRQRYVIPSIQDELITSIGSKPLSSLTAYSYYTEYDDHGRVYKQYIPGRDFIYSLYDKRGRLVLTQDGNQRPSSQWTFMKYDNFNRPIMTGIHTGGQAQAHNAALQSQTVFAETRGNAMHGYTNNTYPIVASSNDVHVINYYDDYEWLDSNSGIIIIGNEEEVGGTTQPWFEVDSIGGGRIPYIPKSFSTADALGNQKSDEIVGLQTGSKIKVLGIDTHKWLTSVVYYDDKYQTIQSISDLYPSGTEIVSNKHNFIGQVTQTKVKQTIDKEVHEYNKWFNFDDYGRLLNIQQQITGDEMITIAAYEYDDFGRIKNKSIHNDSETTTYRYSVPGANISQSSPSFSYRLWFEKAPMGSEASGRHDGNLGHVTWTYSGLANSNKGYKLDYDQWGQMKDAFYMEDILAESNPINIPGQYKDGTWTVSQKYTESGITYDQNGNILSLSRGYDSGILSNYTFYYDPLKGNSLDYIKNNNLVCPPFEYDNNGNLTQDAYKGINFEYNILDLPKRIFGYSGEVKYIYSATGEKLAQEVDGSLTYYRSVMVYGKQGTGSEQLMYILHPEGIATKTNNGYQYNYFKSDHTGSTRVLLAANGNNLVSEQQTDYYPFGLAHQYNNVHVNKYLFGGKELQDAEIGGGMLGMYDFHARFYNPFYGRWFNTDPALQSTNPYLYCANSPMMYVDPDGQYWWVPIMMGALMGGGESWINGGSFWKGALKGGIISTAATYASMGVDVGLKHLAPVLGSVGTEVSRSALNVLINGGSTALKGGNFLQSLAINAGVSLISTASELTAEGNYEPIPTSTEWTNGGIWLDEVQVRAYRLNSGRVVSMNKWLPQVMANQARFADLDFVFNPIIQAIYAAQDSHNFLAYMPVEIAAAFMTGGASVAARGATTSLRASTQAINSGKYTVTRTVAKNVGSRPYIKSPSTITNVMRTGHGIPDLHYTGGINYTATGTFNGATGIYELGINPETRTIYHFLFKTVK